MVASGKTTSREKHPHPKLLETKSARAVNIGIVLVKYNAVILFDDQIMPIGVLRKRVARRFGIKNHFVLPEIDVLLTSTVISGVP